jgi:hypothetical protein
LKEWNSAIAPATSSSLMVTGTSFEGRGSWARAFDSAAVSAIPKDSVMEGKLMTEWMDALVLVHQASTGPMQPCSSRAPRLRRHVGLCTWRATT